MKRLTPLLALALAGCFGRQPPPPTLGDLKPAPAATVQPAPTTRISASRAQVIASYEAFLATARDPRLKAEALRRLADLRLEQAEERSAERADAASMAAAIALYRERLASYPNAADNDRVLYQLSRAYENTGDREQALAALNQLVRDHSSTALRAEAEFRRGEILFVDGDYAGAEAAYTAVLARGEDSGFYPEARYKRGWAAFKRSRYLPAVDDFMALFDLRAKGGELRLDALSRAEREQVDDALRAVSLAFSYLDGPASIADYYRDAGHRRHEDVVHGALAELYLAKERYSDAAATLTGFVEAQPNHRQAPLFQLRAIEVYQNAGFADEVLAAKQRFVVLYGLDGPFWANRKPADHPEVVGPLETTMKDLARHFHALAQKSKREADYRQAFDGYRRYLKSFGGTPGAQEMHFLYAELLFEAKLYAEAADQYEHAAYDFGADARAAEAGFAALVAYEAHGKHLRDDNAAAWETLELTSAQRFAARFPAHPKAAPALTRAAERLFARGEGPAAAQAAELLLSGALTITEPQRLTAWTIVGHTAFDRADYLKAEHAYQQVLASPALTAEQEGPLRERMAAAIYKQAEGRRQAGDLAGAVDDLLRIAKAAPASAIRATAEYDAAALLIQLKTWPRAVAVLEAFRQDHPGHALQGEVTQKLAVAYLENGDKAAAAREFGRIAEQDGDPELQREAYLKSAELHEQVGAAPAAAAALEAYVTRFPAPLPVAVESYQKLGVLYGRMGNDHQSRQSLIRLVRAESAGGSGRTERTRTLAAQASLTLADLDARAYQEIRLVEPLKQSLARKRDAFQTTLKAYDGAAAYGIAGVTTQATFRIAQLYGDFAKALLGSERPKKLDADALEQYELMLEEQAYPFEEKAIAVHEANTRRAAQGVYDDWVKESYRALAQLMPARYGKQETQGEPVDALD